MTFDRSKMRTSRKAKFDVESLGERIVPTHLGFIGAGGHVHLNLIEKLGPGKPFDIHHHHHGNPIIVTAPVTFNTVAAAKPSPLPVALPGNHPIIATAPVTFFTVNPAKPSPLPVTLPGNDPIIAPSPLPDNASPSLLTIYEQYWKSPAAFTGVTSTANNANLVLVQSDKVGIIVRDGNPTEFQGLMSELKQAGLTNVDWSSVSGTITGMLPIAELVTIANFSDHVIIDPELVDTLK
jgi:hypothetical protein